ncbi:18480_t:CDS:2, partial [Rhizophagus irregularis]
PTSNIQRDAVILISQAIAPYGNIYVNLGDFTESPDLEKLDIIKIGRLGD